MELSLMGKFFGFGIGRGTRVSHTESQYFTSSDSLYACHCERRVRGRQRKSAYLRVRVSKRA